MRSPRRLIAAAAMTATAATLAACGTNTTGTPETAEAGAGESTAELVAPIANMECDTEAEPSGDPVVVGGSLSLTGAFAPTAQVHEAVAEIVVDWVNACGGVQGRPLEWTVLDDQSVPGQAASNYERLISDGVDLVMGPYATPAILAAAGPVGRAGYAYPTHTFGSPDQLIGDFHFPSWQMGAGAEDVDEIYGHTASMTWDALAAEGDPQSTYVVTMKQPANIAFSRTFQAKAEEEGAENLGYVEYEGGTTDFSSIALRVQSADPDILYLGVLGADLSNIYTAFQSIGYNPKNVVATLPAPSSIPALGADAENLLALTVYEDHAPLNESPVAQYFAERFNEEAQARSLFPVIETQAAASLGAWQILLTAAQEVGPENEAIIDYLQENEVETIGGTLSFDGYNGYGTDVNRLVQIQDGERVLVAPADVAGSTLRYED